VRRIIDIQKQLLPDLTYILDKRYKILHQIMLSNVIGRRSLVQSTGLTERVLRSEVEFLREQGLVEVEAMGIRITPAGRRLVEEMEPIIKSLLGLSEMEEMIRKAFNLKQVVIVPGDSDTSPFTKQELGRAGAAVLRRVVNRDDVVAVAGGSTLAEVADGLTSSPVFKDNLFVPARGGLGEDVELQANSIASAMAKRTGCHYRLLHVPDHLSEDAYVSLSQEPNIQELVEVIRSAKIVIHGIGNAVVMAKRRGVSSRTITELQREGVLAEAFGYYFSPEGKVVRNIPTVGLRLEDIEQIDTVIGVAGGQSKAQAIISVLRYGHEDILVTDEAAADKIYQFLNP
jgi:central glycolytic genes regulator